MAKLNSSRHFRSRFSPSDPRRCVTSSARPRTRLGTMSTGPRRSARSIASPTCTRGSGSSSSAPRPQRSGAANTWTSDAVALRRPETEDVNGTPTKHLRDPRILPEALELQDVIGQDIEALVEENPPRVVSANQVGHVSVLPDARNVLEDLLAVFPITSGVLLPKRRQGDRAPPDKRFDIVQWVHPERSVDARLVHNGLVVPRMTAQPAKSLLDGSVDAGLSRKCGVDGQRVVQ